MLSKSNEQFSIKCPPVPFAVAVKRVSKLGCKIKLSAAAKSGRGFGVSFNSDDSVLFRLFFDLAYNQVHLCRNEDAHVDSISFSHDFFKMFKLKIYLQEPLVIKVKDGPTFSLINVTNGMLDQCNMICVHGEMIVVKAVLYKFIISTEQGRYEQPPENQPYLNSGVVASTPSSVAPSPSSHEPPSYFQHQHGVHFPPPSPHLYHHHHQQQHPPQSPHLLHHPHHYQHMTPPAMLPQPPAALPMPTFYHGAVIEDKDGHNQRLICE